MWYIKSSESLKSFVLHLQILRRKKFQNKCWKVDFFNFSKKCSFEKYHLRKSDSVIVIFTEVIYFYKGHQKSKSCRDWYIGI